MTNNHDTMKAILLLLASLPMVQAMAQSDGNDSIRQRDMDEVTVKAWKRNIHSHDGMLTVDLPHIVKDKPVSNILEAIAYLPGVVDNGGDIGLAGTQSVTILLDGELTGMPKENLYRLLQSLPVDRLKHVEMMYTAPARYHTDGAVINIVLKTPRAIDGLRGQARLGYNQAHYASYGGTLMATYAVKEWTFDLNYDISRSCTWNNEVTRSNHLFQGTRTMIEDDSRRTGKSLRNSVHAAAGYSFGEKSSLRLTYTGQVVSDVDAEVLTLGTRGNYLNRVRYHAPIGFHNVTLRYTSPFGMTVGGEYTSYFENRTQTLAAMGSDRTLSVSSNMQDINACRAYIDQQHNLRGWQLSYGLEYRHTDDHSSQHYTRPVQPGFSNTTREDVADAYVGLQHSFRGGLSFNASAKAEYYHNRFTHNWNVIPQLGATYYKTPNHIFQLNFSTKSIFPQYWEMHASTGYLNDYSIVIGNPLLQPYRQYQGLLSYILRQKYTATFYVQYGDGATIQLPYQSPDELRLIYQTINMDYRRTVGVSLNAPFKIGDVWDCTATTNIYSQRERATDFHDISFDNSKWVFYGALNNTIRFTRDSPIALSVDLAYLSPSIQGMASLSSIWKMDAGLKWSFGKKRCCELDLKATDIFNRWSPTMAIDHKGQDFRMKVRDMSRNLHMTFIWRFNGFQPKETTVDLTRFGTGK